MAKSLIEIAFDVISEKGNEIPFAALWKEVIARSGISEEEANRRVGQFYTNLMLDGRFVNLGENVWDLRERHTFDKVHIDMKDAYSDVEESEDVDEEEQEEQKAYNEVFEEKKDETDYVPDDGEEVEEKPASETEDY